MGSKEEYSGMITLAKNIVMNNSRDRALQILDNLYEWIESGSDISPSALNKIASEFNGEKKPLYVDYDKKVKSELMRLYSEASVHGDYNVELLEAGIKAKRDYGVLHKLADGSHCDKSDFDLIPYIVDNTWSDWWISQLDFCSRYQIKHASFIQYIMSVFTPLHNPGTFHEVFFNLKDADDYKIPLDWLKDTHWEPYVTRCVVRMYLHTPWRNWGLDIVKPWMSKFVVDDIYYHRNQAKIDRLDSISDKWKNVSPKLEYALNSYFEDADMTVLDMYREYTSIKGIYHCDGDELAVLIYTGNFPKDVLTRNEYYHECVDNQSIGTTRPTKVPTNAFDAAKLMGGDK